jgi:ubiquinone biosynthesis protein
MGENVAGDKGFRVPQVEWERTGKHVLTLEWVDGIPASDRPALVAAGHDMPRLGRQIIQSFLAHALRDGFFHADMHQGNLFVDKDGTIVAVDFGIMGRLGPAERRYFADILYGFVMRDYRRVAEVHFEAGYVPRTKNVDHFAQALRAVGEPIFRRAASDVSMGKLLAQLFEVTAQFDMQTRPELILLQKTMVVVEGVARHFDPENNIWESAEPFLREWVTGRMAPETRLEEGAAYLNRTLTQLPELLTRAERTMRLLSESVDEEGVRLHPASAESIARTRTPGQTFRMGAFWVLLGVLIALLLFH